MLNNFQSKNFQRYNKMIVFAILNTYTDEIQLGTFFSHQKYSVNTRLTKNGGSVCYLHLM